MTCGLVYMLVTGAGIHHSSSLVRCRERREEVLQARRDMFPYLQAEHDIRYSVSRSVMEAYETEIMSDVEGWEVGKCVYKTREWMPPMPKYGAFQYVFD